MLSMLDSEKSPARRSRVSSRAGGRRRPSIAKATLIRAYIGLRRGLQMAPRERDQLLAIRRPQRSDNRNVVAARTIESIRESIGIRSDAVDLLRKLLDRLDEACIAAQLVHCAVKMQGAVEYRQQIAAVDGLAMLPL